MARGIFIADSEINDFADYLADLVATKIASKTGKPDIIPPYTLNEAKDYLKISKTSMRNLIVTNQIKYFKIGTEYRIDYADLLDYKERRKK